MRCIIIKQAGFLCLKVLFDALVFIIVNTESGDVQVAEWGVRTKEEQLIVITSLTCGCDIQKGICL